MRLSVIVALGTLAAVAMGCSESNPSGPTVHCFDESTQHVRQASAAERRILNANVPTGKVQVTCPTVS